MTGSAIKVEGGTITVGTGTTVSSNVSNSVVANAGTFNLNGGTVNGPSGNAISSNTNGTINILSGTVNSTNNSGIYSAGTLNISGGKISTNKARCRRYLCSRCSYDCSRRNKGQIQTWSKCNPCSIYRMLQSSGSFS